MRFLTVLSLGALSICAAAAVLACSSDSSSSSSGTTSGTDAGTTTPEASTPTPTPPPAAQDAGSDSGPTWKECTDAELAAATLATNGSDISFFTAGVDGGALKYDNNCVRIPAGKDVGWYGDFQMHPLEGNGEPGTPIPTKTSGNDSGRITFPNKGKFSFHCMVHPTTMYGTVLVE